MKKLLVTSLAIGVGALVLSVGSANATSNGGGIVGTLHDLSSDGGYAAGGVGTTLDPQDRICIYCHSPHNTIKPSASPNTEYLPLWNRELIPTTATFTMYDNGDADPTDASHMLNADLTGADIAFVSKLCLSCHDGSLALNAYGTSNQPSGSTATGSPAVTIPSGYIIGAVTGNDRDLSNHHPIGFDYAAVAAADDEIAASTASLGSYTIGDLLYGGNMECVTCHDVHNTKNTGDKFVWTSNDSSAFCCACHLKCQ
jgi:hypothetical protein